MKLEYYCGRPFESLISPSEEGGSDWGIRLAGNCLIRNYDGRRTALPPVDDLNGMSFLAPVYDGDTTTMQFGFSGPSGTVVVTEIPFTATLYSIADDNYTGGQEIYPQVPVDAEATIPPDPSPDRVADGPDQGSEMPLQAPEKPAKRSKVKKAKKDA